MNPWAEQLRDAILSNSAIRNGIQDDEAQQLIDWGLQLAQEVTAGLTSMPDNIASVRFQALSEALPKLLTRVTWVAVHREKKGPDWTMRTLNQLNELNQTLHGVDAPQLGEERMVDIATAPAEPDVKTLIGNLIIDLSPQPANGENAL